MSVPSRTDLLRRQEVIAELGQRAIKVDDIDRLLLEASKAVAETLGAGYCAIFELLPGRNEMRLRQGVGWREELISTETVPIDRGTHLANALESEDSVIVNDRREESWGSDSGVFTAHDVVSGITAIIGGTDNPWGALGLYTTEKRKFTGHDAKFVQNVTNILSSAIDERTVHRPHDEETLKSEIVEAVNDGVYVLDEDGRFTMVNEAYCEITGYSRDELLGSHATLVIDEEVLRRGSEMRTAMLEGQADNPAVEVELQTATGDRVPVEGTFAMLPDDDESEYQRIGVVRDITERKERERALAESEQRYRALVENFPNGAVGLFDENLEYTLVGGEVMEHIDISAENIVGKTVWERYPENVAARFAPKFEAALAGESNSFEVEFHDRYWLVHTLPVRDDEDGIFAGMIMVQDITNRKQIEQDLRESEAKFRMLAENLEEVAWISDPETREILYVNPAFEDVWGRDRDSIYENPASFLEAVHPDDRDRIREAYAALPEDGFDEEYRVIQSDGETRWLHARAVRVHDEDGAVIRIVGIADDITERKERERALAESEQRYRTLVENFPNGAVGLFDEDLRYTAVGGQLVETTGIAPEDRIGSSVHEIYPDDLVEEVEPHFHAALAGEANSFEVEFHDRYLLAHTLPIRDADDEVFAGMLVVQDVTDRREYQRQLERSNARLESFASMLAHELRNPLQISQMYLPQVADGDERAFGEVDKALTRIEETIDILLMLSKGSDEITTAETVDLASRAEEAWATTATEGAELIVDTTQVIRGKSNYLHHLFENLFRNAIEHADDTVTVRVGDLDEVPASEGSTDESVGGFYVADDGPGIPADEREAIFGAGYSSDANGTGLGLTLVAQLADAYNWEYTVTDSATGGARFEFTNVTVVDEE